MLQSYSIDATALLNSYFGDGEGPYHLSGLDCRGDERTLLSCPRSPSTIGYHTCSPGNDAGVRCDGNHKATNNNIFNVLCMHTNHSATACNHGDVRLFGGNTEQYGVAEVCINGLWADICPSGSTPSAIASAFCRQYTGPQSSMETPS